MVGDPDTRKRTSMRENPSMAMIKPSFEQQHLLLDAPNMQTLKVPLKLPQNNIDICHVVERKVYGVKCAEESTGWLSRYLGSPFSLYYTDPVIQSNNMKQTGVSRWHRATRDTDKVAFHDFAPYNAATQASLDDLNTRLESKVDIRRFRPNIFISGSEAWDEDNWVKIYIGETTCFSVHRPCDRCTLTTVSPDDGSKDPKQQPLKELRAFRTHREVTPYSPMFGLHLLIDYGGVVRVGDPVYVVRGVAVTDVVSVRSGTSCVMVAVVV